MAINNNEKKQYESDEQQENITGSNNESNEQKEYPEVKKDIDNTISLAEENYKIMGYVNSLKNKIGVEKDLSKIGIIENIDDVVLARVSYDPNIDGSPTDDAAMKYLARIFVMSEALGVSNVNTPEDLINIINKQLEAQSFSDMELNWKDVLLQCDISIISTIQEEDSDSDEEESIDHRNIDDDELDRLMKEIDNMSLGGKKQESSKQTESKETANNQIAEDTVSKLESLGLTKNNVNRIAFINELRDYGNPLYTSILLTLSWGSEDDIEDTLNKYFPKNQFAKNVIEYLSPLREISENVFNNIKRIGMKLENSVTEPSKLDVKNLVSYARDLDGLNKKIALIMSRMTDSKVTIPMYRTSKGIEKLIGKIYKEKGWSLGKIDITDVKTFTSKNMEEKGMAVQDMTVEAANGRYDDFSVNKEVEMKLWETLARTNMKSAVLLGEAGSGKTTAIKVLARQIAKGNIPGSIKERYKDYHIISISAGELAGNEYQNSGKEFIKALRKDCCDKPVILFIDEIHAIFKAGIDLNELKSDMASGRLTIIGASTPKEWKEVMGKDKAFISRIDQIGIETSPSQRWKMIMSQVSLLERKHNIKFEQSFIKQIKRDNRNPNPRDVVTIFDKCASMAKVKGDNSVSIIHYRKYLNDKRKVSEMVKAA